MRHLSRNFIFTVTVIMVTVSSVRCSPVGSADPPQLDESDDYGDEGNVTEACVPVEYDLEDVTPLGNHDVFLRAKNITLRASEYKLQNGKIQACVPLDVGNLPVLNCSETFEYTKDEYRILSNGSAVVGPHVIPAEEYEISGDILLLCAPEEDEPSSGMTLQDFSIYVGQIGSFISIVSLILHLCTFVFLPSLRNLPGYNLASLSVAFLFAYAWVLIGQIPQVLGLACVVSAVLQQNFFLAAFFCMNVLAFDVFRTLKLATEKLVIRSRRRQLLWYSLYAWGSPAVITVISVVVDNADDVPELVRPGYGKYDICWMTNKTAKAVFFAAPAFTLIIVNAVFFVMSSWMISSNTMKVTKDQTKQNAELNYVLYLRLAIMMGVTWLVGIIAIIVRVDVIWFLFDLLNSLQGLFLFLLFTCTRKVFNRITSSSSIFKVHSTKQTTVSSNSSTVSLKTDCNAVKLTPKDSCP